MSVHKDYPEGCAPSAGPFDVVCDDDRLVSVYVCKAMKREIVIHSSNQNRMISTFTTVTSSEARELAAALIECADFIDRAAMTTEDKAKDAGDGR